MPVKLTEKEYVDRSGVICPNCLARDVNTSDFCETSDGGAVQNCYCGNCKAEWTDIYKLECYSNLEIPVSADT